MGIKENVDPTLQLLKSALDGLSAAATNIDELSADEGAVDAAIETPDGVDLVQQIQRTASYLAEVVESWPDTD